MKENLKQVKSKQLKVWFKLNFAWVSTEIKMQDINKGIYVPYNNGTWLGEINNSKYKLQNWLNKGIFLLLL